jgi:hypothetical protein
MLTHTVNCFSFLEVAKDREVASLEIACPEEDFMAPEMAVP